MNSATRTEFDVNIAVRNLASDTNPQACVTLEKDVYGQDVLGQDVYMVFVPATLQGREYVIEVQHDAVVDVCVKLKVDGKRVLQRSEDILPLRRRNWRRVKGFLTFYKRGMLPGMDASTGNNNVSSQKLDYYYITQACNFTRRS
jgi:hypothetical protein